MRAPTQRDALGLLFAVLAMGFAVVTIAAFRAERWVIAVAAAVLALWIALMVVGAFRSRR